MNVVWGLVFVAVGMGLMIYARKWVEWFGVVAFFEQKLGTGGTYTGIRLIGLLSVVVGMFQIFGLTRKFLAAIGTALGF